MLFFLENSNYFCFTFEVCLFNPLDPNISMYILHTVLETFPKADKENLFNNQELI